MNSQENTGNTYGSFHLASHSQLSQEIALYRGESVDGTAALLWIPPKAESSEQISVSEAKFFRTLSALPAHLSLPIIERDPTHPPSWVAHRAPSGQSIDEFTTAVGQLDIPIAQSLFIKLIDLVQGLHAHHRYHGNLRPETIFVGEDGIELAPSYEVIERRLNSTSTIAPTKWTSKEKVYHEPISSDEDVQAIALLFIFVLGGIRDPGVTMRTELLVQAKNYLLTLSANKSSIKILLETLKEYKSGRPSLSEVLWAIENLTNLSIEKAPAIVKSSELPGVKRFEPSSPFQLPVESSEVKKRSTKKVLIYSLVSIIYLVTAILLVVAKSNNSSLNSEVKELNGQIDSLLNDIDDKDNTISDLEDSNASLGEDLSSVQYDLATANSTIDVLQQPQSTYFDYDGSWQLFSNGDESCRGWTDSARVCTRLKNVTRFTISSGSVTFSDNIISSIYAGYSTSGGFFGSVTEEAWGTCGDLDTYANVTFNLIADTVSPRVSGIQATDAHGEITLKVPSQRGCDGASLSFSFTATR
jgi:hypothetical protein